MVSSWKSGQIECYPRTIHTCPHVEPYNCQLITDETECDMSYMNIIYLRPPKWWLSWSKCVCTFPGDNFAALYNYLLDFSNILVFGNNHGLSIVGSLRLKLLDENSSKLFHIIWNIFPYKYSDQIWRIANEFYCKFNIECNTSKF